MSKQVEQDHYMDQSNTCKTIEDVSSANHTYHEEINNSITEMNSQKRQHYFLYKTGLKEIFANQFAFRRIFQAKIRENIQKSDLKIIQCKFYKNRAVVRSKCKPKCSCKIQCRCDSKCTCTFKTNYDYNTDSMEFFIIENKH